MIVDMELSAPGVRSHQGRGVERVQTLQAVQRPAVRHEKEIPAHRQV